MTTAVEMMIQTSGGLDNGEFSILFEDIPARSVFLAIADREVGRKLAPCNCNGECEYLPKQVRNGSMSDVQAQDYIFWVCNGRSNQCHQREEIGEAA